MYPNFAAVMKYDKQIFDSISKENDETFFKRFEDTKTVLNKCKIAYEEISCNDCNDAKLDRKSVV